MYVYIYYLHCVIKPSPVRKQNQLLHASLGRDGGGERARLVERGLEPQQLFVGEDGPLNVSDSLVRLSQPFP